MTEKVSQSHTGQFGAKPSRDERDEAYSAGGGRQAGLDPVVKFPKTRDESESERITQAPIGTELETLANEID